MAQYKNTTQLPSLLLYKCISYIKRGTGEEGERYYRNVNVADNALTTRNNKHLHSKLCCIKFLGSFVFKDNCIKNRLYRSMC